MSSRMASVKLEAWDRANDQISPPQLVYTQTLSCGVLPASVWCKNSPPSFSEGGQVKNVAFKISLVIA